MRFAVGLTLRFTLKLIKFTTIFTINVIIIIKEDLIISINLI